MTQPARHQLQIDDQGRLILPAELARSLGLVPGSSVQVEQAEAGLFIRRSTGSLARVYVEPTNACNLDCVTCMRNVWDEPLGRMQPETFARVLDGVRRRDPRPTVFFGGFGEPLSHPDILSMVRDAKAAGAPVELITNAILLDERAAQALVDAGLDRLWVSLDGSTPERYADVRLGAALPQVIENVARLRDLRAAADAHLPGIGVAFVAMKRNLDDLPEVVRLGKRLGADRFSISNLLPHTEDMRAEVLYTRSMYDSDLQLSSWSPEIALPRMDLDEPALAALAGVVKGRNMLRVTGQALRMGANTCPFLEKGSLSVRWDGAVSPCLPLLHTHTSYLGETRRTSRAYAVGNISECSLDDLWNDPAYLRLRDKLRAFDFSPCTFCNSCDMAEANLEDCFGSEHPACGGCLWAQGFIQCP